MDDLGGTAIRLQGPSQNPFNSNLDSLDSSVDHQFLLQGLLVCLCPRDLKISLGTVGGIAAIMVLTLVFLIQRALSSGPNKGVPGSSDVQEQAAQAGSPCWHSGLPAARSQSRAMPSTVQGATCPSFKVDDCG